MSGTTVNPTQQLGAVRTPSDKLTVRDNGELAVDGHAVTALLAKFGSPLFVVSEATLRENYRRIRNAFSNSWPTSVNIMYAIKSNASMAIRAVLNEEGAGGDCFSDGELFATFKAGADPGTIALNGGCKTPESLHTAVKKGILINIDARSELEQLRAICEQLRKPARVGIRMKAWHKDYDNVTTDYFGGNRLADYVQRNKWGFSVEGVCELIEEIRRTPELQLIGLSSHIGRASRNLAYFKYYGQAVGQMLAAIHTECGFAPEILDIGGGWPRERDPESRSLTLGRTPLEDTVATCCQTLLSELNNAGIKTPALWVEPGRFIVGNASTLLASVKTIKHDLNRTWVNIDASTNDLPRIDTSGSAYHVLAATGMDRDAKRIVDVVGPTCIDSIIGRDVRLPDLNVGEAVAILDAGMYSETASTQFNSLPRPATILVSETSCDIIKRRETIADVFRQQQIPARLKRKHDGRGER